MKLKTALANLENGKTIFFQMNNTYLLDHTVMEFLHDFQHNYEGHGGKCVFLGMETHDTYSRHPLAARIMKPGHMRRRKSDHYGV
jgi:MFS superfamily sulfate permease-like transporter